MDINSHQELDLKAILVDLEDKQSHLQSAVDHLETEVKKKEIEVQRLLSERELELAKESSAKATVSAPIKDKDNNYIVIEPVAFSSLPATFDNIIQQKQEYSSEFCKEAATLLTKLMQTSQEISSIIKL